MKKNRGKLIFILLCVGLSLYFLYPTWKDYQITKELRSRSGADSLAFLEQNEQDIRDARAKRLKLGLDLQGGMRVVLEVNTMKLLEDIARNKDETFEQIIGEVRNEANTTDADVIEVLQRKFQERGIRLSKYYFSMRDTDDEIISRLRTETDNAVTRAQEIVDNRVNQYGVSEPSIQKQGARRIIVELPGVSKEAEVRQLLQGTALLEFKLLIDPEIAAKVYESVDKVLAGKPLEDSLAANDTTLTDSAKKALAANQAKTDTTQQATDSALAGMTQDQAAADEKAKKENPFFFIARPNQVEGRGWTGELIVAEEDKAKVMRILGQPEIKRLIPADMSFSWSAKPSATFEGIRYFMLYAVKATPELTGGVITDARASIDPTFNTPIVNMEMNTDGAREWARITGANIQKRIAIIMDNACFSAPVVQNKITGGNSQITGMESVEEARLLEIVLKAGALPAPVDIVQQASVGPSLGEDSIRQGLWSSLLAVIFTALFMLIYYSTGGTIADIAFMLNILFVMAVLAAFQGTLTLPGIAGIILTVAISVDANVLIFERIREEAVTGKTLSAAIDGGYKHAFTAIFDANVTTFITGVILYQFGSGPIQGFALTLMIGIAASMFSALTISRVIIDLITERGKSVSFG